MLTPKRTTDTQIATLGIGAAAVAIVCCAGLPTLAALLGGLTLGAILGLGVGAMLLGALAWTGTAILIRKRQRRRRGERNEPQ